MDAFKRERERERERRHSSSFNAILWKKNETLLIKKMHIPRRLMSIYTVVALVAGGNSSVGAGGTLLLALALVEREREL